MLSTNKLRSIYSKIQTILFYMIPEKWDSIYLYASIIEQVNHLETGEMFFYYYPAGLIKKNPINVYEIPNKFNIEEEEYMKLVNKLYSTINELRQAFRDSQEEKMWSSLTIIVKDLKFNIEYSYDDLIGSQYSSYDRHIIWQHMYLGVPLEKLTKRDRKMVQEYLTLMNDSNIKTYSEPMYRKKVHNLVEYRNDDSVQRNKNAEKKVEKKKEEEKIEKIKRKEEQKKEENPKIENNQDNNDEQSAYQIKVNKRLRNTKNKVDKYELYKINKQRQELENEKMMEEIIKLQMEKNKKKIEKKMEEKPNKNQILNI